MSLADWRLEDVADVRIVRCAALEGIPGVSHAFSTRLAHARSDFDLGGAGDEAESVLQRRREFLRAAGLGDSPPAILRQVHGKRIVNVSHASEPYPEADGSIRLLALGSFVRVPAVRTADCVALLVVDPRIEAVAAVHAGWRGVVAGIAPTTVGGLAALGCAPRDLVVAMGPAILSCCYEVGEDVVAAIRGACPPGTVQPVRGIHGGTTVDLHAALRAQLRAAGVPGAAIHGAPWCTRCRNDLFFSVRAEGAGSGRLMAAIGPTGLA